MFNHVCQFCGKEFQTRKSVSKFCSKECAKKGQSHNKKHGLTKSRIYAIYMNIKARCKNPNNEAYKNYGGRGIVVCNEWLDEENGFMNFYNWAMSNGYNDDLTIDRIDVNGNYEPSNCRWATYKEQNNNRRDNNLILYNNTLKTLPEWCEQLGLNYDLVYGRMYKNGFSFKEAINIPLFKEEKITIDGETKYISDWCKYFDIKYATYKARVYHGMDKIEAFYIQGKPRKKQIEFDGKSKYLKDWCSEYNINYNVVNNRLKRGWTIGKALTTPVLRCNYVKDNKEK